MIVADRRAKGTITFRLAYIEWKFGRWNSVSTETKKNRDEGCQRNKQE